MPIAGNIDQFNYRDLLRVAFEAGLIENVEKWFEFREARNQTSHTYDEKTARAVYNVLPEFIQNTSFLINQLKRRLES